MPSIWRCEILRCSCSNLDTERTQRWLKQSDSSVSQQNLWKPCSMVSSQTALNLARQRLLAHTVWKAVDRNLHSVNLTNLLVLHIKTNLMEEKMFAIDHNNLVSLKLKQILTFCGKLLCITLEILHGKLMNNAPRRAYEFISAPSKLCLLSSNSRENIITESSSLLAVSRKQSCSWFLLILKRSERISFAKFFDLQTKSQAM